MVPDLPVNPLKTDPKQELMKLLKIVYANHSTGPWMTGSDYDVPSADYLSKYTAGPLTNQAQDTNTIQSRLDQVLQQRALEQNAADEKSKRAMQGPTRLR